MLHAISWFLIAITPGTGAVVGPPGVPWDSSLFDGVRYGWPSRNTGDANGFPLLPTVLVQLLDGTDPESGERYTLKRYESKKVRDGESWRHAQIILKPVNPDFASIVLTGEEGKLQVIAELLEVLGVAADAGHSR